MTFEKIKVGLLICFVGMVSVIFALFVPTSIIFFTFLVGFLFVIPILAIASVAVIGTSIFSKKQSKSKKQCNVIST